MGTFENKVGLEAEFFLAGKDGRLLYPGNYGFQTDEFIILGEFRAEPGTTRPETLSNFFDSYYKNLGIARKKGFDICLLGVREIDLKRNAEILREMGSKPITESKNIYGTDILELSDNVIKDGKIVGRYISTGLHVHFSSIEINKRSYDVKEEYYYTPVEIPLNLGGIDTTLELFKKDGKRDSHRKIVEAQANRITKPVIEHFVRELDEKLLKEFLERQNTKTSKILKGLKFRQPGFYEDKFHGGFEYRSLPFNYLVLEDIYEVVDFSFSLLEAL